MNSQKPVHFSDHFGIDKAKLIELGVFDPILNFDTKVFVEPLLLKESSSAIIRASYQNYRTFFANLLLLLQKSDKKGDKCWRTAKAMVDFPEYQFTCIGYSHGNTEGRGSGIEFNDRILQSAIEIVDKAEGNPEIFLLLPLLEEGIAGDRISDMAQNIIDEDICRYTKEIMNKLGLEGGSSHTTKNYKSFKLLSNPYSNAPIKLVPKDILLNLPVADDIDTLVEEMTSFNSNLRYIVNRDIGDIWHETTKSYRKGVLLNELKTNKEFFVETLKALKEYSFEHYDLQKDYEGLYRWLENSQDFISVELAKEAKECADSPESITSAVSAIIHHFRDTIENKEVWRTFWTECGSEFRHVRVYYSQMLFFTVCNAWLTSQGSNIVINLKHDQKRLDLEFTISGKNRLIVHIKHANNNVLVKGYKTILEKARDNENEKHFYLVMNFKNEPAEQLKEIKVIENPLCKIFEVDVTKKDSKQADDFFEMDNPDLDSGFIEFEDMEFPDTKYTQEKRKGGASSYRAYKPLKEKTEELCKSELSERSYSSANQLCNKVANIIEEKHSELLESFQPYQTHELDGNDWKRPTFYGWCNDVYKSFKNRQKAKSA